MPTCIVPLCPNRSSFPNKKPSKEILVGAAISFHRLPKNEAQRKTWLDNLKISGVTQKQPYVCSVHFNENSFEKVGNRTYLRNNAVPILWPEDKEVSDDKDENNYENWCLINPEAQLIPKEVIEISQTEFENMIDTDPHPPEDIITCYAGEIILNSALKKSGSTVSLIHQHQILDETCGEFKFEDIILAPVLDHDYSISPILENRIPLESKNRSSSMSPERKCCSEKDKDIVSVDRSTSISPVRKMDSPEVLRLNKVIEYENKRKQGIIDNLRRKLQRRDKQIADLKMKLSTV